MTTKTIEPNKRIVIEWPGYQNLTTVEWMFKPIHDGTMFVRITEAGFAGTDDELTKRVANSTEGFSLVLAGLKALLGHNVRLNLVGRFISEGDRRMKKVISSLRSHSRRCSRMAGSSAQASADHRVSAAPATVSWLRTLASLALPHAKVTSAQLVAAGAFTAPNAGRGNAGFAQLPAFCRVAATLTPSPDSQIQMEIWLPAENWNGKFLAVGNGGWAGVISLDAIAAGLRWGDAAASNDTGHPDAGAQFALNHDKLVDFAYRAMHEMTVQSKTIVGTFYSRPPRLSYYQGCSTGGRQGMMEAQRYPDDFDANIAGAPVYNMVHLNVSQTALQVDMLKNPDRIVPQNKVTLIANAVVAACDVNDGVKDDIINDPRACKFDPGTLACRLATLLTA